MPVISRADIKWALSELAARADKARVYREYYRGKQDLAFAKETFKRAFGNRFAPLSINLCKTVVNTISGRLKVDGFSAETTDGGNTTDLNKSIQTATAAIWEMNRMKTRVRELLREALTTGESFLIVWPEADTEEPVLYPQHAGTCVVQYHDERVGFIIKAAKVWQLVDKKFRLNLYYPDRIEKYITSNTYPNGLPQATGFVMYEAPGEAWPLANPWGKVPVFHFPNGEDCDSELVDIIGPQNAVNKTVCDQLISMEFFAMPQRWAIGVEDNEDALTDAQKAQYEKWKAGADRIWTLGNETGKFGQFDPSDPNAFLEVKSDFRNDIAVLAGIPPYHFKMMGGDVPSGAALSILESRLTEKIEDLQEYWGNPLADAMRLALEMKKGVSNAARLKTDWEDTTPHDPLAEAQTQEIKQRLGVTKQQSLGEMGYSPAQVLAMEAQREKEQTSSGNLMAGLFNQGNV